MAFGPSDITKEQRFATGGLVAAAAPPDPTPWSASARADFDAKLKAQQAAYRTGKNAELVGDPHEALTCHDLPDSVESTLAERGKRYGDFSIRASIAQRLQDDMRSAKGWNHLTDDKRQALTVIADKIARILSGDPEYKDNWHDIQGYAKLCEDRCHTPAGECCPALD